MKRFFACTLALCAGLLFASGPAWGQFVGGPLAGCTGQTSTGTGWTSGTSVNATQVLASNITGSALLVTLDQGITLTGGAISFLGNPGDGNYVTVAAYQVLDPTSSPLAQISLPYSLAASTNKQFLIFTYGMSSIELKLTTAITGTGTITPYTTAFCGSNAQIWNTVPHNLSQVGGNAVQTAASGVQQISNLPTPSSASTYALGAPFEADALTSTTTVKSSAGNVYGLIVTNANTSTCYLEVFNTTSPTLGTTEPIFSFGIPATSSSGGGWSILFPLPVNFSTAIAVASTTASKGGTTCSTGMTVNVLYQ